MTPSPEMLTAAADQLEANARFFEEYAKKYQAEADLTKFAFAEKYAEMADELMTMAREAALLAWWIRPTN